MRRVHRLEIIGRQTWRARNLEHAIELAVEKVRDGETWRITVTVGSNYPTTVYAGVGRRDLDVPAGVVDEAAG